MQACPVVAVNPGESTGSRLPWTCHAGMRRSSGRCLLSFHANPTRDKPRQSPGRSSARPARQATAAWSPLPGGGHAQSTEESGHYLSRRQSAPLARPPAPWITFIWAEILAVPTMVRLASRFHSTAEFQVTGSIGRWGVRNTAVGEHLSVKHRNTIRPRLLRDAERLQAQFRIGVFRRRGRSTLQRRTGGIGPSVWGRLRECPKRPTHAQLVEARRRRALPSFSRRPQ